QIEFHWAAVLSHFHKSVSSLSILAVPNKMLFETVEQDVEFLRPWPAARREAEGVFDSRLRRWSAFAHCTLGEHAGRLDESDLVHQGQRLQRRVGAGF